MTHAELVERAGRWLLNTRKCKLVILEPKPWSCKEHPDAIGWTVNGESIIVECKASRDDFRADSYKKWREFGNGMGFRKYYLTPAGLLTAPNGLGNGCGLLEVHGRRVKVIHEAIPRQHRGWNEELCMLIAQLSGGRELIGAVDAEKGGSK